MKIEDSNEKYLIDLFDIIRVVYPIEKKIKEIKKPQCRNLEEGCKSCYNLFGKKAPCINCISYRAYKENNSFIKLESLNDRIYLVMVIPIIKEDESYVIEAIRDITENKILYNINHKIMGEVKAEIERINTLIVTDELTGAFNRRFINERLVVDVKKAQNENLDFSLAMLDIDYFKRVNDEYGHLVGDYILKEVVAVIKKNIRKDIDLIARYGGEEFVLAFANTNKSEAIVLANKLKNVIENSIFNYDGKQIKLTVSIGLEELSEELNTVEKLIDKADNNLYKAKQLGRNLVIS